MLYILCIVVSPLLCCLFVYLLFKDEIKENDVFFNDDSGDIITGFIVGSIIIAGVLDWVKELFFVNKKTEYNYYYSLY